MRCAPGGHEAALTLLRRHHLLDRRQTVLDVGCGSGAWLARLRNEGLTHLAGIDLDTGKFGLRDASIALHNVDLNTDFAGGLGQRFGLVCALEVIEHLECPRHLLRQLHPLLTEAGHLLISTPNVATVRGRLKFLRQGELRYFDRGNYQYNHHISPLTDTQMQLMLEECGYRLIEVISVGSFDGWLKRAALGPVSWLAWLLMKQLQRGEINIYLAARTAARAALPPQDWS